MADEPSAAVPSPPKKDHGRAGRDLPKAIGSGVTLGAILALSLAFFQPAFMVVVAIALVGAVWELHRGLSAKGIDIPEQPLMVGGVIMLVLAYVWGAPALVTATAVTSLVIMLWLLRRGVSGFVQNATAAVFTLIYVAFLMSFVGLMLNE
ncbi:MAG TPA: phosphatidate cytidylyltransferase, partial [Marmoricola sp.]|nr:phosphatidate cytidylyltransferase [Marmoricola sp.]